MGVWSPAFHHQFLDGNLLNFAAAPGSAPSIWFEGPNIGPTPPEAGRGFPVRPGNRFEYQFRPGLFDRAIGIDLKVDLTVPPFPVITTLMGEVTMGNGLIRLLLSFHGNAARIQLFVGSDVINANFDYTYDTPIALRARWHTHGQGQLWVNGKLHSYEPAMAPARVLAIGDVRFGHHDVTSPAPGKPAFLIRKVVIRVLRDTDAVRALDKLHPLPVPLELDADCRRQIANFEAQVSLEMRDLMRSFITSTTRSWSDGVPGGPYAGEAVLAHEAATQAGRAFLDLMRGRAGDDATAVENVKRKVQEFLAFIRANDAAAYDAAIARLEAMPAPIDASCANELQSTVAAHSAELQPVTDLLSDLWTTMKSPTTP